MNRSFNTTKRSLAWVFLFVVLSPATAVTVPIAEGQDATTTSSDETDGSEKKDDEIEEPPYEPLTKSQLQKSLSAIQYKVTQNEETEPAFRNKYWDNKKKGLYRCVVCEQSLFSSETKYKSGTGWPSFYDTVKKKNVGYKADFHLFYGARQEVHCSRCKAHLGHVFDDGPRNKTGKRYCMNSASLKFEPKTDEKKPKARPKETSELEEAPSTAE